MEGRCIVDIHFSVVVVMVVMSHTAYMLVEGTQGACDVAYIILGGLWLGIV